jgi:hypothetical protein
MTASLIVGQPKRCVANRFPLVLEKDEQAFPLSESMVRSLALSESPTEQ